MKKVLLYVSGEVDAQYLPKDIRIKLRSDLTFPNPAYADAKRAGKSTIYIEKSLLFYELDYPTRTVTFPRGYLYLLVKMLKQKKCPYEIIDETLLLPEIELDFIGKLRDYQRKACNDMIKFPNGILEASTGAGKTVTALALIAWRKQPTLIIVHNKELLYQWQGAIKKFLDYDCGIYGDGRKELKPITVGIINSIRNDVIELEDEFGHIVVDECFPAGTMIDGRPIETIKIGDYVRSFNHKTNKIEKKKVTYLFKKNPETLCTIKFANGKEITCTENHPFFTNKGYLTASSLSDNISVLSIDILSKHEKVKDEKSTVSSMQVRESNRRIIQTTSKTKGLSDLQKQEFSEETENSNSSLLHMSQGSSLQKRKSQSKLSSESNYRDCAMLGRMCTKNNSTSPKESREISSQIQQEVRKRKNEEKQSFTQSESDSQNKSDEESKGNTSCLARRERRERKTYTATRETDDCARMGVRNCCKNGRSYSSNETKKMVQKEKCSDFIQSGCGEHTIKDSHRDRREKSFLQKSSKAGQEERIPFKMERVESVTIHKRTDRQQYGRLCSDGFVYNIEVEDNHNYFVDDILVHNCHRCPSRTWTETLIHFPAKYTLGLSATPYRRDGLGEAIPIFVGPRIHTVSKKELHKKGAVLKPNIIKINTMFSHFFKRGDAYAKMLKKLTEDVKRNELIADIIERDIARYNEPILVVSDRVAHCKSIEYVLKRRGIESRVLTGKVSSDERTEIVKDMRARKVQVLIATISLIGEGFDAPNLYALFLTTPIKFSGRLIQVIGRILRPEKNKRPRVYDFVDWKVGILKGTSKVRDKIYKRQWGTKT
jgi:superfamily II DNA or RNA helicase